MSAFVSGALCAVIAIRVWPDMPLETAIYVLVGALICVIVAQGFSARIDGDGR